MIRFRMLGTVDLTDAEGREIRSVLRRPKLLALLGYLAAARPVGFHRRDTLVALLWAELDNSHARNALRQAVHALREGLGHSALLARGEEEVGLSDECVACDVREFETALAANDAERTLDLYHGGMLNGVHVADAPEFERWLDEEREHLRQQACAAARLLVERAAASGNATAAARWATRLTELSPFDETAVRRLIQLLDRAGDQAGAVRAYEEFERRIGRDLEVLPSSETRGLVDAIRAREPSQRAAVVLVGDPTDSKATQSPRNETSVRSRARIRRSRSGALLAVLALSVVTSGGFLIRAARNAAADTDAKRVVVLPFANQGPPEGEYFADGITEEIATRLTALARLRIIGSTTARSYKATKKTIAEIGKDLGVTYVLEGSVRWESSPEGQQRVRVMSQLVSTADGMQLWAQVYDEPLDGIFRVQSDIAKKVAQALNITLLEAQRRVVEAVPTRNVQAYDYYLRGIDYMQRGLEQFQPTAIHMFEKAIELDSSFALAYAMLSRTHSRMYLTYRDRTPDRLTKAKWAVDKAFALEPNLAEAHQSLGTYYWIGQGDYERALREYAITEGTRPNDYNLFNARAVLRSRQGDYIGALRDFAKARELDPGSALLNNSYGENCAFVREFERAESLYSRAIALSPDGASAYYNKAQLYMRRDGSTKQSRAVLAEAEAVGIGNAPWVKFAGVQVDMFDGKYGDALGRLASGSPDVFAGQQLFITRAHVYADVYALMGRREQARAYFDSAGRFVLARLREHPDDARLHSALGLAYAGLGRKQEAIQEGQRGIELRPISKDAYQGYYRVWELARIYVMVGENDAAIDRLEYLLSIPGYVTPAWLRIDPAWAPLRSHPRFQKLVHVRR
jgi:serine/threonine-protein kinase